MSDTEQVTDDAPPEVPEPPETPETPEAQEALGESADADAKAQASSEAQGAELTDEELEALSVRVEAALLTADRAITAGKVAEALSTPEQPIAAKHINKAVKLLNGLYEKTGRSFRVETVAGGFRVMTLPQYAGVLANLHKKRQESKLSPAALETLAIIAYKQPIIRAEIENIRGVACGEVLRSLMERHLVKIVGRAEEIGRPMLYGTTKQFLEVFGLSSLKDLPKVEELKAGKAGKQESGKAGRQGSEKAEASSSGGEGESESEVSA